jgi:hypothetical protein
VHQRDERARARDVCVQECRYQVQCTSLLLTSRPVGINGLPLATLCRVSFSSYRPIRRGVLLCLFSFSLLSPISALPISCYSSLAPFFPFFRHLFRCTRELKHSLEMPSLNSKTSLHTSRHICLPTPLLLPATDTYMAVMQLHHTEGFFAGRHRLQRPTARVPPDFSLTSVQHQRRVPPTKPRPSLSKGQ